MIDNVEALKAISAHRGSAIVVATMTANFEWPQVSDNPGLDMMFSGAMGKASSLGLGLALSQPEKKVIVLDGDGSLLMNLGSLVTIANMAPSNLVHFLFDNSVYRTTGGQPVPGARKTDFTGFAEAAGYAQAYGFDELEKFKDSLGSIMSGKGPTFICLKVPPATERPPYPIVITADIIPRFKKALEKN